MPETPEATAIDAKAAEKAAENAALAAQAAIAASATAAANAEEEAKERAAKLVEETKQVIGNQGDHLAWLKDHAEKTHGRLTAQEQLLTEMKAEQQENKNLLSQLRDLLIQKPPEQQALEAQKPPEIPPEDKPKSAEDRSEVKTKEPEKQKRMIRRL